MVEPFVRSNLDENQERAIVSVPDLNCETYPGESL